ncbi:hypothetical protein CFC21_087749 [Triticum aestivum]|uniref:Uncharacterized protein n=2 Tax=Triticum aestivum TaxID=4565 RepID=A0A9R1LAU0_WHEAT|nr:hypothetical protein CFC21_087749 [Triticum aestivum]
MTSSRQMISTHILESKGQLFGGPLLALLKRARLHLGGEAAWRADQRHRAPCVRVSVLRPTELRVDGLTGDDDRVDHLTFGVVHGQHLEPAPPDVLRVDDGVQEAAGAVRAPHDQGRPLQHVRTQVGYHLGLLLGRHADKRGEEDHVVRAELLREVGDVRRVELHARAHAVLARAEQLPGALVGRAAQVVVVEVRIGQVVRGEDEGAERQRAGADEGDARRRDARHVARQELVLQPAEVDVVTVVGEAGEVVERVVEGGEQVGVVRLELPLGGGAEADERLPHPLVLRAELRHVDGARRDARGDEVGEEPVDLGGRAQRRQLGDGGLETGDLLDESSDLLVLGIHVIVASW